PGEILAHGASPRQPLWYITKVARLSLYEPKPGRFIPVTEASVQRCRAAGSARPELVAGQHGADGFDQLRLRHGALRFGLLLQMLLAAFFQLSELGADDQILDRDFALGLLVGALHDDARRVAELAWLGDSLSRHRNSEGRSFKRFAETQISLHSSRTR